MSMERIKPEQPTTKLRLVGELEKGDTVLANGVPVIVERRINLPTGEVRLQLPGNAFMQADRDEEVEVPAN